jgi:hypothetical protein
MNNIYHIMIISGLGPVPAGPNPAMPGLRRRRFSAAENVFASTRHVLDIHMG